MISIIIPVYNQARKMIGTLESLQRQSFRDYEIIIINDGSTDNLDGVLGDFVNKYEWPNRLLVLSQENHGAPVARNRGYRESKGDFLFFCDADAILEPHALEIMQQTLIANPKSSFAYSSFWYGKKLFALYPYDPERLKKMPYIHTMSLIRRSDFPEKGWDEKIKKLQDWDLWLTMLKNDKTGFFINQVLFKIQTGGTISSWVPSFAYKILPFLPSVKKYKKALAVIKTKHGL